jgi:uncharacterized protein YndB with AHSA1/START domain
VQNKNSSKDIKITRLYNAPINAVWEAWNDKDKVAKWWGPRGYSLTTQSKELKPGGHWNYTMHGPDGVDYINKTFYHEVQKNSKLVYDHGGNDERNPLFRVSVNFLEEKEKTKMEMTMTFPSPEEAEQTGKFIKQAGGNTTWDRLAEFLEKESSGKEIFVINRSFNTSVERMCEIWTNPKEIGQWMAPTGFKMEFIKADIRPGGKSFYVMEGNENVKMYGRAEYLKIEKPNSLVYTQQFCDENEKVSRHPMAATWPETMLTNVEFTEEGGSTTRVCITWEPYGSVSKEELETFVNARAGMTQGWTGSFDKLESYLNEG